VYVLVVGPLESLPIATNNMNYQNPLYQFDDFDAFDPVTVQEEWRRERSAGENWRREHPRARLIMKYHKDGIPTVIEFEPVGFDEPTTTTVTRSQSYGSSKEMHEEGGQRVVRRNAHHSSPFRLPPQNIGRRNVSNGQPNQHLPHENPSTHIPTQNIGRRCVSNGQPNQHFPHEKPSTQLPQNIGRRNVSNGQPNQHFPHGNPSTHIPPQNIGRRNVSNGQPNQHFPHENASTHAHPTMLISSESDDPQGLQTKLDSANPLCRNAIRQREASSATRNAPVNTVHHTDASCFSERLPKKSNHSLPPCPLQTSPHHGKKDLGDLDGKNGSTHEKARYSDHLPSNTQRTSGIKKWNRAAGEYIGKFLSESNHSRAAGGCKKSKVRSVSTGRQRNLPAEEIVHERDKGYMDSLFGPSGPAVNKMIHHNKGRTPAGRIRLTN